MEIIRQYIEESRARKGTSCSSFLWSLPCFTSPLPNSPTHLSLSRAYTLYIKENKEERTSLP